MERHTLWNRDFLPYWLGIATSALGDAFVLVALPFVVLAVGGGAGEVAATMVLASVARLFGPAIGALADRWPLRLPLLAGAAARAAIYAALGLLALHGRLELPMVYAGALLNGVLTTFVFAAGNVALPTLVPRAALARANALMQAATMGVPLLGLGVAGALVATLGAGATLVCAAPAFALLGIACAFVRFPPPAGGARPPFGREVVAGAAYLAQAGPLALVFPISLLLNGALAMMNVVMPLLMETSGRGAAGFGWFETAVSLGMLLGIGAVSAAGARLAPQHLIAAGHGAMAAGFAVMAAGSFGALLAGGGVLGFGIGATEVAAVTLLQLAVPAGMRGKVMGAVLGANALGLAGGAWLAGRLGDTPDAPPLFALAALVVLATAVVWVAANRLGRERLEELVEGAARAT